MVSVAQEDSVLKNNHREWVPDDVIGVEDDSNVMSIIVTRKDGLQFGVSPVESAFQNVDCQRGWPFQFWRFQYGLNRRGIYRKLSRHPR